MKRLLSFLLVLCVLLPLLPAVAEEVPTTIVAQEKQAPNATAQPATEQIEGQADFGGTQRFTLLREGSAHTLAYSTFQAGAWVEQWRNDRLLPDTDLALYLYAYEYAEPTLHESVRFTCLRGDTLDIYAGEEHPDLAVTLCRTADGTWQVAEYSDNLTGLYAYLFADCIVVNGGEMTALQTAGIRLGKVDQNAATFDPAVILNARETLRSRCGRAPNIDYFAEAEPLYMCLGLDILLPVYTGPGTAYARAAKGKAAVSFEDWTVALCKTGSWMMVLYETSAGRYRTGWVDTTGNAAIEKACALTMPAKLMQGETRTTLRKTALSDDLLTGAGSNVTLKKGAQVTLLWEDSLTGLSYVETETDGENWRGFVRTADLQ